MIPKINAQHVDHSARIKSGAKNSIDNSKSGIAAGKKNVVLAEDKLMLSQEGCAAAEVAKYANIVKNMPDSDADRLAQVRAKLENGDYFQPDVADKTAGKMLEKLSEDQS